MEAMLNSLREQSRCDQIEIESLNERIWAERRTNGELEYKLKELERKFNAARP